MKVYQGHTLYTNLIYMYNSYIYIYIYIYIYMVSILTCILWLVVFFMAYQPLHVI